jgi:iron complex transport system permease protein
MRLNGEKRRGWMLLGLLVLLWLSFFIALEGGDALLTRLASGDGSPLERVILQELRFPRALAAMSIGAGLAMSGVALQVLFRNPLAEPGLIGVSSGAALGAVLALAGISAGMAGFLNSTVGSALGAFMMGIATTYFLYRLATRQGRTDAAMMLLAGVALNAINGAAVGLVMTLSNDAELRTIIFWLMGSLSGVNLNQALGLLVAVLILFMGLWRQARGLDRYLLGEAACLQMGEDPQRLKQSLILLTTLFVAFAVAQVGVIAFVGLIVPHMMRFIVGAQHRWLLPASALAGALLVLWADQLSQWLLAPSEVPIGLLMALLGGPFFLGLLLRQRTKLAI